MTGFSMPLVWSWGGECRCGLIQTWVAISRRFASRSKHRQASRKSARCQTLDSCGSGSHWAASTGSLSAN